MQAKLWNLNALSVELAKDRRSLARQLEGLEPDDEVQERGRVSRRWRMARVFEHLTAAATGSDGESLDLNKERARLAREQADKLARENAIEDGLIAYLPDVAEEQARVFEMIRTKTLSLPTKCAPHANPENPNLARDAIEREVHELLAEISAAELRAEQSEQPSDVRLPAGDPPSAAEADGDELVGCEEASEPGGKRGAGAVAH